MLCLACNKCSMLDNTKAVFPKRPLDTFIKTTRLLVGLMAAIQCVIAVSVYVPDVTSPRFIEWHLAMCQM